MPIESAVSVAIAKSAFSFTLMAVIAMASAVFIHFLVAGLGAMSRRGEKAAAAAKPAAPPAAPAAPIAPGVEPGIVAVIAAAVAASIGPARIVWIGEASQSSGWTAETRARQHTSHNPHP
jgi:uncharacterized SAM-binding protein YcdF (DUF218 family)